MSQARALQGGRGEPVITSRLSERKAVGLERRSKAGTTDGTTVWGEGQHGGGTEDNSKGTVRAERSSTHTPF